MQSQELQDTLTLWTATSMRQERAAAGRAGRGAAAIVGVLTSKLQGRHR